MFQIFPSKRKKKKEKKKKIVPNSDILGSESGTGNRKSEIGTGRRVSTSGTHTLTGDRVPDCRIKFPQKEDTETQTELLLDKYIFINYSLFFIFL